VLRSALLVTICCCGLLSACNGWRGSPSALDGPIPQRKSLQIWSGGRAVTVHGVTVRGDSVRAVPGWQPPSCDTCAIYYSRASIDSVRVRVSAPLRTALLVTSLIGAAIFAIYAASGPWMS
jgi:hypothetical protein